MDEIPRSASKSMTGALLEGSVLGGLIVGACVSVLYPFGSALLDLIFFGRPIGPLSGDLLGLTVLMGGILGMCGGTILGVLVVVVNIFLAKRVSVERLILTHSLIAASVASTSAYLVFTTFAAGIYSIVFALALGPVGFSGSFLFLRREEKMTSAPSKEPDGMQSRSQDPVSQ